jgi:hypothetical protein
MSCRDEWSMALVALVMAAREVDSVSRKHLRML